MAEKYTIFLKGPFSQWYKADFTDPKDGKVFNCCEQWMMYQKAMLFKDYEIAQKIMDTEKPREQKALGRQVKNYVDAAWNAVRKEVVKNGNRLKFTQNKGLLLYLKDTVGTTLVEANPEDSIWGVGLAADDPKIQDKANWKGLNLLGEVLTELRIELIGE